VACRFPIFSVFGKNFKRKTTLPKNPVESKDKNNIPYLDSINSEIMAVTPKNTRKEKYGKIINT
jgi:hypothetical protein